MYSEIIKNLYYSTDHIFRLLRQKYIALTTKRLLYLFSAPKSPDVSYDAIEERLNLLKQAQKNVWLATPPTEPTLMGPSCPEIQSNNTRVNLNLNVSFVVFIFI